MHFEPVSQGLKRGSSTARRQETVAKHKLFVAARVWEAARQELAQKDAQRRFIEKHNTFAQFEPARLGTIIILKGRSLTF